jgi:hypothetical protein
MGCTLCTTDFCRECKKCKNNCEGWFPNDKSLSDGCKESCKSDPYKITSADAYLDMVVGYESPEEEIERKQRETELGLASDEQTNKLFKTVGIIGVVMVLIIASFLIIRKMK